MSVCNKPVKCSTVGCMYSATDTGGCYWDGEDGTGCEYAEMCDHCTDKYTRADCENCGENVNGKHAPRYCIFVTTDHYEMVNDCKVCKNMRICKDCSVGKPGEWICPSCKEGSNNGNNTNPDGSDDDEKEDIVIIECDDEKKNVNDKKEDVVVTNDNKEDTQESEKKRSKDE